MGLDKQDKPSEEHPTPQLPPAGPWSPQDNLEQPPGYLKNGEKAAEHLNFLIMLQFLFKMILELFFCYTDFKKNRHSFQLNQSGLC